MKKIKVADAKFITETIVSVRQNEKVCLTIINLFLFIIFIFL